MCNNMTSSSVKWFQRLIDFCLCIDENIHDRVQEMISETSGLSEDKVPFVDNIPNSNSGLENISVISKDLSVIAESNISGRATNTFSTVSSAQCLAVDKENVKIILNDILSPEKIPSANSKGKNGSLIMNGLIANRDLPTTTAQNGVKQISSSKSPSQPVILNGKPGVFNSKIYDSSKVNESKAKNVLITDRDLQTITTQNSVSQISSSKSPSQPVMLNEIPGAFNSNICDASKVNESKLKNGQNGELDLLIASALNFYKKLNNSLKSSSNRVMLNEESSSVNGKNVSNDITNGGEGELQTGKLVINENCSQTESGQNHVNKVCRYSLNPLPCKTGSLKNANGKHGELSNGKEQVGSFIKVSATSYMNDIIQNVSNKGKGKKIRTKSNDESQTKNLTNYKNLTSFPENGFEKNFKYSSGSLNNKIEGMPNQSEQIEHILRCFERSRAVKDDKKVENQISLDNNKLRLRRLRTNYTRSVSLQPPTADPFPTDSLSNQQNVDKVKNKEVPSSQTSSTCGRHSIKRLSLPNIFSGCSYVTAKESEIVKLPVPSIKTLKVPDKSYRVMSFPDLHCGGTVVFHELSKYISLPNLFDKDPIVYNVPCPNLNIPPILPSDDLKIERERGTGGGLIKENNSKKISLPDLISRDRCLEEYRASSGYGSTSSGGLVNTPDTDHIFYSDIHSNTVACEQLSSLREFMNTENSAEVNVARPISESYISDFLNRDQQDSDESRRKSSGN